MSFRKSVVATILMTAAVTALPAVRNALCCPFCSAPTLVMAEELAQCDHLLLGRWKGGEKPADIRAGTAQFEILEVGFSLGARFEKGQTLELPQYIAGIESSQYVLMGPDDRIEDWFSPVEASADGWKYLSQMPPIVTDPAKQAERLLYFIPYFEHPDLMVSNDAYSEFAAAPYEVIKPLRDKLPREKILGWLNDPKVQITRTGFYGLMAGLCGRPEDADILEQKILTLDSDFRLGIDGVMAGYILLKGEAGLKVLEDARLNATTVRMKDGTEAKMPFSEVYAVMQTLRFLWQYEPDLIPRDRLKQTMHVLLDRPELADLVITDLARWKDWTVQDRLMAMYDEDKFDIPSIRRSIVKYLLVCSQEKGTPADDGTVTRPDTALRADELLKVLEEKDPRTVTEAKRFLIR
jgi:hypothetical protein